MLLLVLAQYASAVDNGMGRVPPLGWNSWCTDVACTKDYCDEQLVHQQIDAIVREGLREIGWQYITLDDCWGGQRLANGTYHWDEQRFPSGIPHLVKYAHSQNLLLGLYLGTGNQTCNPGGRPYKIPGSLGYYAEDALTLTSWGVDYIKLDWCGMFDFCGATSEPDCKHDKFREFSEALNRTGKPTYLAASSVIGTPDWAPDYLNSWRIGGDHHDWWMTNATGWMLNSSTRYKIHNLNRANHIMMHTTNATDTLFTEDGDKEDGKKHKKMNVGPRRGWNDADFIFTGGQGCGTATGDDPVRNASTFRAHCPMQTPREYRTAFTMWAIGGSPLLVAVDVHNMTDIERSTITNPHVAGMHVDSGGIPGVMVAVDQSCHSDLPAEVMVGIPACQVWAKPVDFTNTNTNTNTPGGMVIALYNSEPDMDFLCYKTTRTCSDGTVSNCCMEAVQGARAHTVTVAWKDVLPPTWQTQQQPQIQRPSASVTGSKFISQHNISTVLMPVQVFDMWAGKVVEAPNSTGFTAVVPPSGVVLIKVTPHE
jgi:alpha-galactosidase